MLYNLGTILLIIGIINILLSSISQWSPIKSGFNKYVKNIIIILLSLELILFSFSLFFINSSFYLDDLSGILISLIIFTLSACEAAIGLTFSLLFHFNYYHQK